MLHNLVLEPTRIGIEVKNLKMRVESLSSRLDFNERRARALEGVVQYRPERCARRSTAAGATSRAQGVAGGQRSDSGPNGRERRSRPGVGGDARRPGVAPSRAPAARGEAADAGRRPRVHAGETNRLVGAGESPRRRRAPREADIGTVDATTTGTPADDGDGPDPRRSVKLAVVVQRYGADINGGAELHARYVAERLARHAQVEVLTTCARDYVTWKNELPAGVETSTACRCGGSPSARARIRAISAGRSACSSSRIRSPTSWRGSRARARPARRSIGTSARARRRSTSSSFSAIRYYHAWHGARAVPSKAILVPTAERDPAVGLAMFGPVFRGVRALMYNSPKSAR